MADSKTIETVIADLRAREALGLAKYGTTVDRKDLSLRAWLQHQYEELLDGAVYAKRAIAKLDEEGAAKSARSE